LIRTTHWLLSFTVATLMAMATLARAAAAEPGDEILLLEVSINGRATNLVAQFTRRQQLLRHCSGVAQPQAAGRWC
jgi:outer membrane usher protein